MPCYVSVYISIPELTFLPPSTSFPPYDTIKGKKPVKTITEDEAGGAHILDSNACGLKPILSRRRLLTDGSQID